MNNIPGETHASSGFSPDFQIGPYLWIRLQPGSEFFCNGFRSKALFSLDRAFPDGCDTPAKRMQCCQRQIIMMAILPDFFSPPFSAGSWPTEQMAIVPMPETAIDLNDRPILRQHNVRTSRQCPDMQPEPKSLSMQQFSDEQFWSGVGGPDS